MSTQPSITPTAIIRKMYTGPEMRSMFTSSQTVPKKSFVYTKSKPAIVDIRTPPKNNRLLRSIAEAIDLDRTYDPEDSIDVDMLSPDELYELVLKQQATNASLVLKNNKLEAKVTDQKVKIEILQENKADISDMLYEQTNKAAKRHNKILKLTKRINHLLHEVEITNSYVDNLSLQTTELKDDLIVTKKTLANKCDYADKLEKMLCDELITDMKEEEVRAIAAETVSKFVRDKEASIRDLRKLCAELDRCKKSVITVDSAAFEDHDYTKDPIERVPTEEYVPDAEVAKRQVIDRYLKRKRNLADFTKNKVQKLE